jgi:hypothetical protein
VKAETPSLPQILFEVPVGHVRDEGLRLEEEVVKRPQLVTREELPAEQAASSVQVSNACCPGASP